MMQQLRATTERAQRPAARVVCAAPALAGLFGCDAGMTNTTFAWNVQPLVHTSAICTHGKYHTWRLQEMPT